MKRDIYLEDVRVGIWTNWGIFGIRGKKYDIIHEGELPEEDVILEEVVSDTEKK
jgi:splicing suppressor protein 51